MSLVTLGITFGMGFVPSTNSWKSDLVVVSGSGMRSVVSPRLARSNGSIGFRSSGSFTPPGVSTGTGEGRRVLTGAGLVGGPGSLEGGGRRDGGGPWGDAGGLLHVTLGSFLFGGGG